jgi:hypothetical protein
MGNSSSKLKKNKVLFAAIAVAMILVFVGSLSFLKNIYQTQSYYVLNQAVSPNQQISPKMLTAMTTSSGTAPKSYAQGGPNLGLAQVQTGNVYSRFAIAQGELLTVSNTSSSLDSVSAGVPDSWVVTSFSVPANQAMDGEIARGNYFDMMVVTPTGAFYPFYNILCLNATVDLSSATSTSAINSQAAHNGQTSEYFVGLPVSQAATLQYIIQKYGSEVFLVLSPVQNNYATPQTSTYRGIFNYVPGSTPTNAGVGTDNTFSPVKRDSNGRPVIGQGTITTEPGSKSPDATSKNGRVSSSSGSSITGNTGAPVTNPPASTGKKATKAPKKK